MSGIGRPEGPARNQEVIEMSGPQRTKNPWKRQLPLLLLAAAVPALAAAPAAQADPPAQYTVNGTSGAAFWGMGNQSGAQILAFAFTQATPLANNPSAPPPGPRLTFSVAQWARTGGGWVLRQWYADVPLDAPALAINPDLGQGVLDATVSGTLVEQSIGGTVVQQNVPGRVQVNWTAISGVANTTLSYAYQTPAYSAIVQSNGPGRFAMANATVTVDALGAPIQAWGFGSLFSATSGLLSVALG
jgi:hypothetical protein